MSRYSFFLLLIILASCTVTSGQPRAERPRERLRERPALDMERTISDLVREEESSSTGPANVEERYRKLMNITMAMIQRNMPVKDILSQEAGRKIELLLRNKELDKAAALVSEAIRRLPKGKATEEMIVKEKEKKQDTIQEAALPLPVGQESNHSIDADGIIWGTEIYPARIENTKDIVNNTLKIKYLKIRLQQQMVSKDARTFIPNVCLPSQDNCVERYDLDEVARLSKANNWSIIPMLQNDPADSNITAGDIDSYVNFVDWFISRYRVDANIRYVELINDPVRYWKGTKEQLLELNNKVYDRIKVKYPGIMIGTPGFEYWMDYSSPETDRAVEQIEYFLDKRNGAKFDFWAFHGYGAANKISFSQRFDHYPPTKTFVNNKYADINGILRIRKKLDENGWQDRGMFDIEHVGGAILPGPTISPEEEKLDAAYIIQELLLKKTLTNNNRPVLWGILSLKIIPRGNRGEMLLGSLKPNGALTQTVKAVSFLLSKFNEYKYSSHINGELDNEDMVWIEKFQSGKRELYIFFKPFRFQSGKKIMFDNEVINYNLILDSKPSSVILTDINGDSTNLVPSQAIALEAANSPKYLEISY